LRISFRPKEIIIDREELNNWIRLGPIRITMNSGDTVDITNREFVTVSSTAAVVLVRGDDGRYRHHVYPFVTMSKVEQLEPAS
jgi:hypothetical protein